LNEDEVGDLEEYIVSIRKLLFNINKANSNLKLYLEEIEAKLKICCYFWPSIKLTANFNNINFILIPRAMQVEEDLEKMLNEYKSIIVLYSNNR
jgi:hypothetical protein